MHLLINVELHLLHSHMQQLHNVISVVFTSKILKVHFTRLMRNCESKNSLVLVMGEKTSNLLDRIEQEYKEREYT